MGVCPTSETWHLSTARLARGSAGAYNERPHGDSQVPPYSVQARSGWIRSALAGVHCDQHGVRVQQCSAALAQPSSQMVTAFRLLPQNVMLGPGVTPGN